MTAASRRYSADRKWWRLPWAFLLAACVSVAPAAAQWSGSVAVVSDYRFRGETLSDEKPAVQAALAYDHVSGWYGGVFGSTVDFARDSGTSFQFVPFVGYTGRFDSRWSWEAGGDYAAFTRNRDYNYGEVYVGIVADTIGGRIYYAPDYFGQGTSAIYAELNATQRVFDRVDLLAHVGVLHPNGSGSPGNPDENQFDARFGAGIDVYGFALRAAWVGTNTTATIYPIYGTRRNTVVVSIGRSF